MYTSEAPVVESCCQFLDIVTIHFTHRPRILCKGERESVCWLSIKQGHPVDEHTFSSPKNSYMYLPSNDNYKGYLSILDPIHLVVTRLHLPSPWCVGSTVTHTFRQSELLQFIIQSISSDAVFGSTGEDEGESCNGCLDVRVLILGICRQFTHLAILENGREHRVKGAGRVINPRLRACVGRGQLTKQANCGRRGRGACVSGLAYA